MSSKTKKRGKTKPKKITEKLTPSELFLDYKIGISRSTFMELDMKKAKLLETIDVKEMEMRELIKESETKMTDTLEKWKEFKKGELEVTKSSEVIDYMHSNWKVKEGEQERILATEEQIKIIQLNIRELKEQIKRWDQFESNSMPSNNQFINLLRKEIESMNDRYESLVENIEKSFSERKTQYQDTLQFNVEAVQRFSVEKALMKLDKQHLEEVKQQSWLQKELSLLKERENKLKTSIGFFEAANVQMCSGIAHTGITSLLWPKRIPKNFSDDESALYHSRVLDLDLGSYFSELDLRFNQSVVDELITSDLPQASEYDLTRTTSSNQPVGESGFSHTGDDLSISLIDHQRWSGLMALGNAEPHTLYIQGAKAAVLNNRPQRSSFYS